MSGYNKNTQNYMSQGFGICNESNTISYHYRWQFCHMITQSDMRPTFSSICDNISSVT